jgi:hypothetical protein
MSGDNNQAKWSPCDGGGWLHCHKQGHDEEGDALKSGKEPRHGWYCLFYWLFQFPHKF